MSTGARRTRAEIVCLLPVRNGGGELAEYLEAAGDWCDAVVALDDGSTDDTLDLLETHPLVHVVVRNPPRSSAAGWHDGQNRNALLDAAASLDPAWIVQVDVDERIPSEDAHVLREFLATDALPRVAYGLAHCRMWGVDRLDPNLRWVYRVFAFDPDDRVPDEPLHFHPVPTSIAEGARLPTSIRLQHFGGADPERVRDRARKYTQADPAGRYPSDFGGLDDIPSDLVPWTDRPSDLPVLVPREQSPASLFGAPVRDAEHDRPLLVVLLPARNCAGDLPDWFASIRTLADAVVALDDGSTDATPDVVSADPLVRRVLTRPVRDDNAGWDDAANRQALLDAAADLDPRWVLFLDADERIPDEDSRALRRYLEDGEADPSCAYAFNVVRMIGDEHHYDRADLWVSRLFAFEPGAVLPRQRLHGIPVPSSIPVSRHLRTTIRILHLASLTEERRRARFAKYREADPREEFQADYGELLLAPGDVRRLAPRPSGTAVIANAVEEPDADVDAAQDATDPVLSAIVIAHDDEDRIERAVRSVVSQRVPVAFEVIVVASGSDGTAARVRQRFPDVTVIDLGPTALPGVARNAGLEVARGDYVSFPGSHVVLAPGSLAARVAAHELGYPMVTGTMRNLTDTRSGWASYYLDHLQVLPGRPSGELRIPPAHCSYDRELLVRAGGFPEDLRAGEDTIANQRMWDLGCRAFRAREVELSHESPCRDPLALVRHHLQRGRGFGRILLDGRPAGTPLLTRAFLGRMAARYVPERVRAVGSAVRRWGDDDDRARWSRVAPLVALGASAAWIGTWMEVLRPRRGKMRALVGTPAVHVVIAGIDRRGIFRVGRSDAVVLARFEPFAGRFRLLTMPRDLLVTDPMGQPVRLNEVYFWAVDRATGADDPVAGLRALCRTVERVLAIRVDGGVLVDFDGFRRTVDALGGVWVDAAHEIDDEFVSEEDGEHFRARFPAGPQHLDGESALVYARTRKADGDAWRRRRHVELVEALAGAALTVASDPPRALDAFRTAVSTLRSTLGPFAWLAAIATVLRTRGRLDQTHLGPPTASSVRAEDGRWAHVGERDAIRRFVRQGFVEGVRSR